MKRKPHKNLKDEIRSAWEGTNLTAVSEEVIDASWENFKTTHLKKESFNFKMWFSYAAMTVLIFSTAYYSIYNNSVETIRNLEVTEKEVLLPDGSQVFLKKDAEITFSKGFSDDREIFLSGEAYFDVVRVDGKEFKVRTGQITTTVLGTSFLIENKEEGSTRISLYSGAVLVSAGHDSRPWKLSPGESLLYKDQQPVLQNFNPALSFEGGNELLNIDKIKLKDLYPFLESRFQVEFDIGTSDIEEEVTFRMHRTDSLYEIMDILSLITLNDYEINLDAQTVMVIN